MKAASNDTEGAPRRTAGLEPDKVVDAAIELLDAVGFEGLSLRRLAETLDVKAAALYWHFRNKQDLINRVATKIVHEDTRKLELDAYDDWRRMLGDVARTLRGALRGHRDAAMVIASADLAQSDLMHDTDALFAGLFRKGFDGRLALISLYSILRFAIGCVLEEQRAPLTPEQIAANRSRDAAERQAQYPVLTRAFAELERTEPWQADAQFEDGLQLLLDGISMQLDRDTAAS